MDRPMALRALTEARRVCSGSRHLVSRRTIGEGEGTLTRRKPQRSAPGPGDVNNKAPMGKHERKGHAIRGASCMRQNVPNCMHIRQTQSERASERENERLMFDPSRREYTRWATDGRCNEWGSGSCCNARQGEGVGVGVVGSGGRGS